MKQKGLWQLFSVLLSAVLALSACGSADRDTGSGESAGTTTADAGSTGASGGAKFLNIVVAKPTVVEDMNTNETSKWLEETTGIKVNYDQIPLENVNEKVALMLAGGELPDIFFNCSITSAQINQYGIQDKVLIQLDEFIDQYGSNLKKAMAGFDQGFNLIKEVDGHIYGLPTINPCYHCSRANKMWINDTWMKALNLEYPETTDDFYTVLKAFKEKDPNGNGKADEIPLTGCTDGWYAQTIPFLINSFLYFDTYQQGFGLDDGKKVINGITDNRFKEALRYLNRLYKEGLLYEGTLTQKNDQLRKLVENPEAPIVGASTAGFGGVLCEIGGDRYRMYRPLAPLKGPQGVQYAGSYLQLPYTGAFVVTSACKDPALALQWGDTFYTHEATATVFNGVEGAAWKKADSGEKDFNGNQALWMAIKAYGADVGKTRNDCWTQMGIFNFSKEWRMGQAVPQDLDLWSADGMEYMLHVTTRDLYEPYAADKYALPTLKQTEDEYNQSSILRTEYNKYYDEIVFKFITGAMDLDKDWNSYLENLKNKYKLDTLLSIYQTAYDRTYGQ